MRAKPNHYKFVIKYDIRCRGNVTFFVQINNLYLLSAVLIAQRLVGLSKQLKQINQIEHNIVKNPNCPEANQMAICKSG